VTGVNARRPLGAGSFYTDSKAGYAGREIAVYSPFTIHYSRLLQLK
jgi:hypothetical protein